jgi:cytochrome c
MMKRMIEKLSLITVMIISVSVLALTLTGCGGDSNEGSTADQTQTMKTNPSGLSEWELENGFGPVKKKLNLGALDLSMAEEGEKIFESKCASCHKLDERYTGPAQRDVLRRVTPEFFMNMVLNPDENIEKHPHTREMLGQYMNRMTNQNINLKDARMLLEYFRVLDEELVKNQNKSNN